MSAHTIHNDIRIKNYGGLIRVPGYKQGEGPRTKRDILLLFFTITGKIPLLRKRPAFYATSTTKINPFTHENGFPRYEKLKKSKVWKECSTIHLSKISFLQKINEVV